MADLQKAVVKGLAEDRGLYMPEEIKKLPKQFFDDMAGMSFQDIAYNVASNFFGDDVDEDALQDIVYDTLSFDCPIVRLQRCRRPLHGTLVAVFPAQRESILSPLTSHLSPL